MSRDYIGELGECSRRGKGRECLQRIEIGKIRKNESKGKDDHSTPSGPRRVKPYHP